MNALPRSRTIRLLWACVAALNAALNMLCIATPANAADEDPLQAVLEKSDQIRFPREGFQVDVNITNSGFGKEQDNRKYRIMSKGNDNTVVITTEPASEKGQILLMKARDLWVFLPDISQPVRLSLSQRLTGEVANGDLARANFAGDYTAKLVRTESIDGETYQVLELAAVDRGVTYHRVLYWVRQSDARPFKAEFYSLSDRLLKTCKYLDYRKIAGQMRPTRLILEDALHQNEQSVLEYSNMKIRDLPDKLFTKDYLKKLE